MEPLGDVDGDVVDAVLHGTLAQRGEELHHMATVGVGDFVGLHFQLPAAFQVDEEVRAGVKLQVHLVSEVIGMEDYDFVLVVA